MAGGAGAGGVVGRLGAQEAEEDEEEGGAQGQGVGGELLFGFRWWVVLRGCEKWGGASVMSCCVFYFVCWVGIRGGWMHDGGMEDCYLFTCAWPAGVAEAVEATGVGPTCFALAYDFVLLVSRRWGQV